MLHRSFKPAKCKTSCRLATSRLKLMKNKKGVLLNQMKRDLAHLLESGQDQTARIRVEHVIREEKTLAAYELLEIYCELIVARMPIIESQKNCAIDLKEAVTSVIFAAPRCADIPELTDIKKYLTAKYGKEFATAAIELRPDCGVSRMLIEKLSAVAPDGPTKIKVLKAIAGEHNVEWEPKAFGEKDAKAPDDLLNGPTGFEKASTMHMEPPKFQAPPSQEQKHQEPIDYYEQNKRFSMGSQDVASKDAAANQSSSGTSHSDARPDIRPESRNSGMSERAGMRQSFQGESNSRSNWNMGFTDAASAAQAAAESAEMASMAARAAAELSIQGRITRQHSSESHKSFTRDSRDERHDRHAKESSSSQSFHDRNPNSRPENHVSSNLSVKESHKSFTRDSRDESHDRHGKESSSNQSFHDRNPNSRPENHSSSNLSGKEDDDRRPNLKQNYSTELRKSSKEDGLGADRNPKLQNERVEKQEHDNYLERAAEMITKNTNTGQRQGYYRKSSFEDEEATTSYSEMSIKNPNTEPEVKPLTDSWQESYEPKNLNPFGGEKFEKRLSSDSSPSSSVNLSNSKVEHIQESNHNSSNDDEEEDYEKTVVFDEYKLEESKMVFDVEPTYDEVESSNSYFRSPDKIPSMEKSNSDDFGTVNFDDSAGPKFDSEDEFEESSRIPADETHSPSETKPRFDFDDVRTEASVVEEPNNSPSKTKPRFDFDDVRTESSAVEEPNNSFSREDSSSGSDSGTGLGFTPLTGGFRNKGYKLPPYKKSADGPTPTDQKSEITNVRSSFMSTEIQNSDEKLRSTVPTAVSDSKTDLASDVTGVKSSFKPTEIRKPDVKLSPIVPTAVSDSDSDDFMQEFQQQKPRVTDFDDSTDSDDDMQVKIPSNRNRFGSGLSRRTKGPTTPSTSGSRVRTRPERQSQSQTLSDSRSQHSMESREDPNQLEKHVTSKPYTEPKVRNQIAGTGSRSRIQLRAESQSQTLLEPSFEARVENRTSTKPFKSTEIHNSDEKLRSTLPTVVSGSKTDLTSDVTGVKSSFNSTEIRKPDVKLSPIVPTAVSDSASDSDDFMQEFQQHKPKVRNQIAGTSSRSRVQLWAESQGQTLPEPRSEARVENRTSTKPFKNQLGLEKPAAPEPVPEPKAQTHKPSSRSKSQSQTLPEPRSEAHVENRTSPMPYKHQLGSEKPAVPEPVPEPKVQTHRPSSRSESQSQTLTESRSQIRTETKVSHKPSYEPKPAEARNQTHRNRLGSEKPAASKPVPEPMVQSSEDSSFGKSEKNSSLNREDSGSNNGSVSHVHPKLPDYDDVFARFQALRENRK